MRAAVAILTTLAATQTFACEKPNVFSHPDDVVKYQGCLLDQQNSAIRGLLADRNQLDARVYALEVQLADAVKELKAATEALADLQAKASQPQTNPALPSATNDEGVEWWWSNTLRDHAKQTK